jgi:hypothetical protein
MDQELWIKMTEHTPLEQLLKVDLITDVEKVEENIWVIKNFASKEILDEYKNYIESIEEKTWWEKNKNWWVGKFISVDQDSKIFSTSSKLIQKITSIVNDDVYLGVFGSIHRLTPGQGMFVHTDNPTEKRPLYDENKKELGVTDGYNNYCILAMVLYLNDFNGGNLYFPTLGVEYHGNAGDLVIFPGTGKQYDHGVKVLEEGPTRYITTGFGYDNRVAPLKKSQHVFEDLQTGEHIEIEPAMVKNNPEEAMKLPPRLIS